MFVTPENAKKITGYDVSNPEILMAQAIVESYIGRVESQVDNANDKMLLERATAYQAAYMHDDSEKIFEQVSVAQMSNLGDVVTFKSGDTTSPWVAGLVVITCKNLSWRKSHKVNVGPIFDRPYRRSWFTE